MIEKYKLYAWSLFVALWVSLCWGVVQDEFLNSLERIRPFIFLLLDLIFIILGVFSLRDKRDILFFVSFVAVALVSSLLNHFGAVMTFNGARDFIGLVLAAPIIRLLLTSKYSERFVRSFDRQLYLFLYVQAICVTWQFLKYGAGDAVGGSMGEGASGTISVLIYFVSFYLMCRGWNIEIPYLANIKRNFGLIILLYPTFLNETKISLVLVVFYFLLLIRINRQYLLKLLWLSPLVIAIGAGSIWVYTSVINQDADVVFSEDNMYEYFVGNDVDELVDIALKIQDEEIETDNIWAMDIPRLSKLVMAPEILEDTGGKIWFGAGMGQFKGASILSRTQFAEKYNWLLQGSRPLLFFIFVQLGGIGIIWMILNFTTIVQTENKYWFCWNMRLYICILLSVSMLYNDSFRLFPYCFILFYMIMIGLSYQRRNLTFETK